MDKEPKEQQGEEVSNNEDGLTDRRSFLLGLGKWSKIIIGSVLVGGALLTSTTESEAARAWANRAGGGGAAWANRGAAWANRGTAWVNRF